MSSKFLSAFRIIFLTIILSSILVVTHRIFYPSAQVQEQLVQQIRDQVKSEIYKELHDQFSRQMNREEVSLLIRAEVQSELKNYLAADSSEPQPLALNSDKTDQPENLKQAIHRIVQEIISTREQQGDLSDADLQHYSAGEGIEPDVRIQK